MSTNISILDRCTGAMLGSAIGDALGWPNENRSGNIHKWGIEQWKETNTTTGKS